MTNQVFTGTPTSRRFCQCPPTIVAGQPVFLGTIPAIALDNYQANESGTTFLLGGTFAVAVTGQSQASPQVTLKLLPGNPVYADGGIQFTCANGMVVTYNFVLDGNPNGTDGEWGRIDPSYTSVGAGLTDAACQVLLSRGV